MSVRQRVGRVNRRAFLVPVFNLSGGKCSLAVSAPEDGLQSAINEPFLDHVSESVKLKMFILRVKRDVRVFPFAEYP